MASTGPFVGPPRTTDPPSTLSTSFTSSPTDSNTSFGLLSSTTPPNASSTSNPNNGQIGPDPESPLDQKSGLLNYYFVFLALFILLLFLGVYFIHRRKKAIKARQQNNGQTALARDLNGWTNTRRWMHGNFRPDPAAAAQRREGLNELGEAPPPYVHAAPPAGAPTEGPEIPLRTLSRDGAGLKPPDYGEAVRESMMITSVTEADRTPHTLPPGSDDSGVGGVGAEASAPK